MGAEFDKQAVLEIARRHGARGVQLFGSFLRGQQRADSDVDLLGSSSPAAISSTSSSSSRRWKPSSAAGSMCSPKKVFHPISVLKCCGRRVRREAGCRLPEPHQTWLGLQSECDLRVAQRMIGDEVENASTDMPLEVSRRH